jgi:biopolymer transport protein ExbD
MAKIKLKRQSPHVDMTPMVDLFSLLLTFFMLTTSFRPQEAKVIDTPSSVSEKTAPEKNVITLLIDKNDAVFFNMDNGIDSTNHFRAKLIDEMTKRYNITLTPKERAKFEQSASFGMPMKDLQTWLKSEDPKQKEKLQTGIPSDSADNQLGYWVRYSRLINPNAEVAIKGDGMANYKIVKKVMDLLIENKVTRFNLTTNLRKDDSEGKPEAKK